jgi:hypothetical protein
MGILENRNFPERTILAATLACVFDGDYVGNEKRGYRPPQERFRCLGSPSQGYAGPRLPSSFANK